VSGGRGPSCSTDPKALIEQNVRQRGALLGLLQCSESLVARDRRKRVLEMVTVDIGYDNGRGKPLSARSCPSRKARRTTFGEPPRIVSRDLKTQDAVFAKPPGDRRSGEKGGSSPLIWRRRRVHHVQ
jgi:hypothetical protein